MGLLQEELLSHAAPASKLEVLINPKDWPSARDEPMAAVMLLIGTTDPLDANILQAVERSLRWRVPIIVAFDPKLGYRAQCPPPLHPINGHPWKSSEPPTALATTLLRLVGVEESFRRIFLSYRRGHGERLARQLRYALLDAGWQVFLDSFSIAPGVDFQRELFRDMDGRSLLLVIESRYTRQSSWVDDEIAFATAHGIAIKALVLPDHTAAETLRFAPDSCIKLDRTAFAGSRLDPVLRRNCIDSIVSQLQAVNTGSYRTRLEDLVTSVAGFMADERLSVTRWGENLVRGERRCAGTEVVLAVGRRPNLADVRLLASAMQTVPQPAARGWLVHRLRDPDADYLDLIQWAARPYGIEVVPLLGLRPRLRE